MAQKILTIALLLLSAATIAAQNGMALYDRALNLQRADRFEEAIALYRQIVETPSSDSLFVARALFRLGESHEQLRRANAEEYYRQFVEKFGNRAEVKELIEAARDRLTVLALRPSVIDMPFTSTPYSFALSPEGRRIVFPATVQGKTALFVKNLDTGGMTMIPGTDGPGYANMPNPFWSPDGRSVGYFHDAKLKRIDLDGSNPRTLAATPLNFGGSWSTTGVIVFVPDNNGPVYSVRADGDGTDVARRTPPTGTTQRHPQFLPDGKSFLYYQYRSRLMVGFLDGSQPKDIGITSELVQFVPPDQLLYESKGQVQTIRFNLQTLQVEGRPTPIIERIAVIDTNENPGKAALSASASGAIAYRTSTASLRQLVWYDRQGRRTTVGDAAESVGTPRISPDGKKVALALDTKRIGIVDLLSGEFQAIRARTRNGGSVALYSPVWSPDGNEIAYGIVLLADRGAVGGRSCGSRCKVRRSQRDSTWMTPARPRQTGLRTESFSL